MKKELTIILTAFAFGLMASVLFTQEDHLKMARINLREAGEKIEMANNSLGEALQMNRLLEKQNREFTKFLNHLDSTAQRKEAGAMLREKQLVTAIQQIQASINAMKVNFPHSEKLLHNLPAGTLAEVK